MFIGSLEYHLNPHLFDEDFVNGNEKKLSYTAYKCAAYYEA
jgi:hypothetical protein